MSIEAKIIEDSVNDKDQRLTTFVLRYPRFIHSEFMTHRMISKNASSSRAIPVNKILASIEEDIARPIHWGQNQKGMQAQNEVDDETAAKALALWDEAAKSSIEYARKMAELGVHKQVVNRITEPFSHISVVATATDWANFFYLRYHPDAQPEIRELGKKMYKCYRTNQPRLVKTFEAYDEQTEVDFEVTKNAHLPFVPLDEREMPFTDALAMSQARCARTSYNNHDGTSSNIEKDKVLAKDLSSVGHFSPFEHQGLSISHSLPKFKGNFNHNFDWIQIRKLYPNECVIEIPELEWEESDV
jgi:thymidylate synthase ThyX